MGEAYMTYHSDPLVRDYYDRGMLKYQPFMLSEHSSELEKESSSRNTTWERKEEMNESEIGKIINQSYSENRSIFIQLKTLDENGKILPSIYGRVEGYLDDSIYILEESGDLQLISINLINNAQLVDIHKWSEVS